MQRITKREFEEFYEPDTYYDAAKELVSTIDVEEREAWRKHPMTQVLLASLRAKAADCFMDYANGVSDNGDYARALVDVAGSILDDDHS